MVLMAMIKMMMERKVKTLRVGEPLESRFQTVEEISVLQFMGSQKVRHN